MSLAGFLFCVIIMFLMDWKTALATLIIICILGYAIGKNKPDVNWGSSNQSQTFLRALKGIHNLTKVEDHVKNYRPKVNYVCSHFLKISLENGKYFFIILNYLVRLFL